MKRHGRELGIKMQGDDAASLQQELVQLGFEIADELKERVFGDPTQKAVGEFQQKQGLKVIGVVDEAGARTNDQVVEAETAELVVV